MYLPAADAAADRMPPRAVVVAVAVADSMSLPVDDGIPQ